MQTAAWVLGGAALALLIWLAKAHWPRDKPEAATCAALPANPGPVRPALKAAIDLLAAEPLAGTHQASDSLSQATGRAGIAKPAPFPASTYVVRFGIGDGQHAVLANAELGVPHYSQVEPGVTAVGGLVRLEGFADPAATADLTAPELDYLLVALYQRLCPGRAEAEAAALNRLKDAVLVIRFGPGPGLMDFHRSLVSGLKASGAAR